MVGKITKCTACGKRVRQNFEIATFYKGFFYHDTCFREFSSALGIDANRMVDSKLELVEYIKELLDLEAINTKVNGQLVSQLSQGLTYEGILASLKYFYIVRGNSTDKANGGIGIVPHIYDETKKWHQIQLSKRKSMRESAKGKIISTKPRVVKVTIKDDDTKEEQLIDISKL